MWAGCFVLPLHPGRWSSPPSCFGAGPVKLIMLWWETSINFSSRNMKFWMEWSTYRLETHSFSFSSFCPIHLLNLTLPRNQIIHERFCSLLVERVVMDYSMSLHTDVHWTSLKPKFRLKLELTLSSAFKESFNESEMARDGSLFVLFVFSSFCSSVAARISYTNGNSPKRIFEIWVGIGWESPFQELMQALQALI